MTTKQVEEAITFTQKNMFMLKQIMGIFEDMKISHLPISVKYHDLEYPLDIDDTGADEIIKVLQAGVIRNEEALEKLKTNKAIRTA